MDATSPLYALLCLGFTLMAVKIIVNRFGASPSLERFGSIDGLRGYLALMVCLHHSCIWYFYLQTGHWGVPPSHLYTWFGQGGVGMFFMVTGFLFFTKILNAKQRPLDWLQLYVSRYQRLVPLYAVAMALLLVLVAVASPEGLRVSGIELMYQITQWLLFTIPCASPINGVGDTSLRMASVTWSLPYEWFFYFSLPLWAFLLRRKVPWVLLALGVYGAMQLYALNPHWMYTQMFVWGLFSAVLNRQPWMQRCARSRVATLLVVALLAWVVVRYPGVYTPAATALLGLAFALIACGNTLGGLLTHALSRTLGEMAYGIYLLHGLFLYTLFVYVLKLPLARSLPPLQFWWVVGAALPLLIALCYGAYRLIEQPAMRQTNIRTAYLRNLWCKGFGKRP